MEKLIEEIIEIVLDNVSCEHCQLDECSTGGSVDYSLDNEKEVMKKCLAAIPAYPMKFILKVDEEYIKEKARKLWDEHFQNLEEYSYTVEDLQEIIRKLINELSDKIKLIGD